MASPWPKSVLVRAGQPVDLFAADGVDAATRVLIIQNLSAQPVLTGERAAAPGMSERGFRIVQDDFTLVIRPPDAADKQWLWVAASASRVVYEPYRAPQT